MKQRPIHYHAIAVHFSNGVIPTSLFFLTLCFLLDSSALEVSAFHTLIVGTLGVAAATVSGLREWRKFYRAAWVPVFKKKLALAVIALISGGLACVLRFLHPDLLMQISPLSIIYVGLNLVCFAAAAAAGYLGGRLVFH